MKRLLFFAMLCCFNGVMAQHYYMYKNQKVNFTEDSTVNLISYSVYLRGNDVQLDSIQRLDTGNVVQRFKKDQFIARSTKRSEATIRNTYKNAYIVSLRKPYNQLSIRKKESKKEMNYFEKDLFLIRKSCTFVC